MIWSSYHIVGLLCYIDLIKVKGREHSVTKKSLWVLVERICSDWGLVDKEQERGERDIYLDKIVTLKQLRVKPQSEEVESVCGFYRLRKGVWQN